MMLANQKGFSSILGAEHDDFFPLFAQAPALLRTLLVADGTVTKLIEAYFLEALRVLLHSQQPVTAQEIPPNFLLRRNQSYLHRKIALVGAATATHYLTAESWIDTTCFQLSLQQSFLQGEMGLGELLQKFELSTYRKIAAYFSEQAGDGCCFCRTYVIYVQQQPAIQITEKFPVHVYELKS